MTRIAILGANGQVGAELCLILRNHPEVEMIPICRNPAGSAFLRYSGVAVRHGVPADPAQAPRLLGDCDVVVNLALASGTPRQIRNTERALVQNAIRFARPNARLIYFSTQNVYGDPSPSARIRWRSSYGRAKLTSEQVFRKAAAGRDAYVLRLGHVCGELQNITALIRDRIRNQNIIFPHSNGPSNTVYTAAIVDAILKITAGRELPGTYDLMSNPEWTWPQVYEFEARRGSLELHSQYLPAPRPSPARSFSSIARSAGTWPLRKVARYISRVPTAKQLALRVSAHLSPSFNDRANATWGISQARADIDRLRHLQVTDESMLWLPQGKHFLRNLATTTDLLNDPAYQIPPHDPARQWPQDLPPAGAGSGSEISPPPLAAKPA